MYRLKNVLSIGIYPILCVTCVSKYFCVAEIHGIYLQVYSIFSVLNIWLPMKLLVISVIRVTAGQQHTPEESTALDPGNHQLSEWFDLCLRGAVNSKES